MGRNSLSLNDEERRQRRKRLDHERYMLQRDDRLKKQHEYYLTHVEQCKRAAKRCYLRSLGLFEGTKVDRILYTKNLRRMSQSIKHYE